MTGLVNYDRVLSHFQKLYGKIPISNNCETKSSE